VLQQLFNAADIAVICRFVGKEAMAAVGSNSPIISLIINLFVGIALGSNVVIAHATGMKDTKAIQKAVHNSIILALCGGVIALIVGQLLAGPILRLTGVPEEVFDMAVLYLRIYCLGMPVILLYNFESAIFRAHGDTKTPLLALVFAGVINVGLNLFLVIVLHRTVDGVAIATVTSNLISSLFLLWKLMHTDKEIRVQLRLLHPDKITISNILRIGVPAGLQGSLFSFANVIVQSAVNSLGATVMAASSAALNIEAIAYFVMNSFSQACTTFVGQNHGAGKFDRCRRVFKLSLLLDACFTGAVCITILIFGHQLLGIFNSDPEVIQVGYMRLSFIFFAYILSLVQEVGSGYLRGFGMSLVPAMVSLVCICGLRLFWIFAIFPHWPSFRTIMLIYPISLWTTGIIILLMILIIRPSRKLEKEAAAI
jgi:putative MATE family efflux protein